mmetsp:Transcript_30372/g.55201  ORF Transcript_30372/g.55201 Transcript_30372/m.55201 type:complete len:274 (-) Transcript_30372:24-845(-)
MSPKRVPSNGSSSVPALSSTHPLSVLELACTNAFASGWNRRNQCIAVSRLPFCSVRWYILMLKLRSSIDAFTSAVASRRSAVGTAMSMRGLSTMGSPYHAAALGPPVFLSSEAWWSSRPPSASPPPFPSTALEAPKYSSSCLEDCSTISSSAYTRLPMERTLNLGKILNWAARLPGFRVTLRQLAFLGAGVLCTAKKWPEFTCCNCTTSPYRMGSRWSPGKQRTRRSRSSAFCTSSDAILFSAKSRLSSCFVNSGLSDWRMIFFILETSTLDR